MVDDNHVIEAEGGAGEDGIEGINEPALAMDGIDGRKRFNVSPELDIARRVRPIGLPEVDFFEVERLTPRKEMCGRW